MLDENGAPTGEQSIEITPLEPGEGGVVVVAWGPYFRLTEDDKTKLIQSLTTATGARAVMAQKDAVEILATALGRDPQAAWEALRKQNSDETARQASLFEPGGPGGMREPAMLVEDEPVETDDEEVGTRVPTQPSTIDECFAALNEALAKAGLPPIELTEAERAKLGI